MTWIIKLCEVEDGKRRERTVFTLGEVGAPISIDDVGLSLEEGKAVMAAIQRAVVSIQSSALAEYARTKVRNGTGAVLKDYRRRRIQTAYGTAELKVPRFENDGSVEPCTNWPANCRSTPEFDTLRARLSAWMSYRAAERLLGELLPIEGGRHHTTFRNRILIEGAVTDRASDVRTPETAAKKLNLGLDCTYIRSNDPTEGRLHEVFFGHIEPDAGNSRVFSSIGENGPDRSRRIRRNLEKAGLTDVTSVSTFTDGGNGLRELARGSGVTEKPILDWHHIAQRLQHVRQAAAGLTTSVPDLPEVTAKIIDEVERLRWRLWHGKPNAVSEALAKIRPLIKTRRRPSKQRRPLRPWNTLMSSLYFLRKYTGGQEAWMINYAQRHRRGDRVGTSQTESAANSLVNKRMNKSQQMRWSSTGAHCLLQVRAAIINGDLAPCSLQN